MDAIGNLYGLAGAGGAFDVGVVLQVSAHNDASDTEGNGQLRWPLHCFQFYV
jgi:hypothetical protein